MNALITKVVAPALASLPAFDEKLRKGATNDLKREVFTSHLRLRRQKYPPTGHFTSLWRLRCQKTSLFFASRRRLQREKPSQTGRFTKRLSKIKLQTPSLKKTSGGEFRHEFFCELEFPTRFFLHEYFGAVNVLSTRSTLFCVWSSFLLAFSPIFSFQETSLIQHILFLGLEFS